MKNSKLKTWIEIKESAVRHNIEVFKRIIGSQARPSKFSNRKSEGVKLASVVKSNAYGHGLYDFSPLASKHGVDFFCVDSVFEGASLRSVRIKKPILVLGVTLPDNFKIALERNLILTLSNFFALDSWIRARVKPVVHIKIDTGMHRQGFFLDEMPRVLTKFGSCKSQIGNLVCGIYTHFASAKDVNYPTYTEMQFGKFMKAVHLFEKAGFKKVIRHAAASASTMLNPKYHLDMVRVGMALYGHHPSKEIGIQLPQIKLEPVLSWKTVISEIKKVPRGSFISYDLTERVTRNTKVAILPIGYWHGLPWSLSRVGEVIINGERAKILGRVTMDVTMADVTDISCKPMDIAEIDIMDSSFRAQTSHYEFLTRINPLIQRIVV